MAFENISQQIAAVNPLLAEQIQQNAWFLPLLALQMIMKVIFYPTALYLSAKRRQKAWFIVLFVCFLFLNDFGLLPILYLVFNRDKKQNLKTRAKKKR